MKAELTATVIMIFLIGLWIFGLLQFVFTGHSSIPLTSEREIDAYSLGR
ncbi:hypothetical protein LCGC14_2770230 [marine sediment metagenome]|uniref:Uncharacterized protein n=1 Tax=marine sediment metagenome TaxID=412755 RepID=A0A0F8ZI66_9ZZZZ